MMCEPLMCLTVSLVAGVSMLDSRAFVDVRVGIANGRVPHPTDALGAREQDADANVCAASACVLCVFNDEPRVVYLRVGVDETFAKLRFESIAPVRGLSLFK